MSETGIEHGLEPDYRRYSILFVEDEDITRHYFSRICEPEFKVITAANVPEALDTLKQRHNEIAVILTDQRMPGPRGGELLVTAKREYPGIVRMLTTAYMDLNEAIQSVNEGEIFRYLEKPWDVELLKSSLYEGMHLFLAREKQRSLMVYRQKGLFGLSSRIAEQVRGPIQKIQAASQRLAKPDNQKVFAGKTKPLHAQFKSINDEILEIDRESQNVLTFVDMLMLDFEGNSQPDKDFEILSMLECLKEAIQECPRDIDLDASIKTQQQEDFTFRGARIMMVHVLMNLIRRGLLATRNNQRGPGVVEVVLSPTDEANLVLIRDNGEDSAMVDPAEVLDDIKRNRHEPIFENAINLGFCYKTIDQMNGTIDCLHDKGRSTQFTIVLPLTGKTQS